MLEELNPIAFVPTRTAERARALYEDVLGLRFVKDDGFALLLQSNGAKLGIARVSAYIPAQFTILGWEVKGIAKAVETLQQKGVHFERFGFFEQDEWGIWTAPPGGKVAWFKDPDGNILGISQHV
jgi:catechol 2,3-dioxygenase-like lactoylglutathione lyase family enzyme